MGMYLTVQNGATRQPFDACDFGIIEDAILNLKRKKNDFLIIEFDPPILQVQYTQTAVDKNNQRVEINRLVQGQPRQYAYDVGNIHEIVSIFRGIVVHGTLPNLDYWSDISDKVFKREEKNEMHIRDDKGYHSMGTTLGEIPLSAVEPMCDRMGRLPFDDQNLCFFSSFQNSDGTGKTYSIDYEDADDEHYQLSVDDVIKLEKYLTENLGAQDLLSGLQAYIQENGFWNLDKLFAQAGISPSHFCYYSIDND